MREPLARGARLERRGREGRRAVLLPPARRWAARAFPAPRAGLRAGAAGGCGRPGARQGMGLSDCGVRANSALFPVMPGPG